MSSASPKVEMFGFWSDITLEKSASDLGPDAWQVQPRTCSTEKLQLAGTVLGGANIKADPTRG